MSNFPQTRETIKRRSNRTPIFNASYTILPEYHVIRSPQVDKTSIFRASDPHHVHILSNSYTIHPILRTTSLNYLQTPQVQGPRHPLSFLSPTHYKTNHDEKAISSVQRHARATSARQKARVEKKKEPWHHRYIRDEHAIYGRDSEKLFDVYLNAGYVRAVDTSFRCVCVCIYEEARTLMAHFLDDVSNKLSFTTATANSSRVLSHDKHSRGLKQEEEEEEETGRRAADKLPVPSSHTTVSF